MKTRNFGEMCKRFLILLMSSRFCESAIQTKSGYVALKCKGPANLDMIGCSFRKEKIAYYILIFLELNIN